MNRKTLQPPWIVLSLLTALSGGASLPVAAQYYTATLLSPLPGGPVTTSFSVNGAGQAVGLSFISDLIHHHAVLWQQDGTVTDLGVLPGGSYSIALSINNTGQIVGWSDNGQTDQTGHTITRAVLWQNGTITDMGTLPGGSSSIALGINNTGQIVGWSGNGQTDKTGASVQHAIVWQNGTISDLGVLSNGVNSNAIAINDVGQIVGSADKQSDKQLGKHIKHRHALNLHPVVWQNGTITRLPMPKKDTDGVAFAINNLGQICGTSLQHIGEHVSPNHPDLWQEGTLRNLNTYYHGHHLQVAEALNDAGQVLADNGFNSFLLTPSQLGLYSLKLTPTQVHGGASATGLIILTQPAQEGGVVVTLTSTNPAASVPSSVTVPQGANSVTFPISTISVTKTTKGTISAGYNGANKIKKFTVKS